MATERIFSNTRSVNVNQSSGNDLSLQLIGENRNANDLTTINHRARASSWSEDAKASGLNDTHLIARSLQSIALDVSANATNGSDWAYGLKNTHIEADRNDVGLNVDLKLTVTSIIRSHISLCMASTKNV